MGAGPGPEGAVDRGAALALSALPSPPPRCSLSVPSPSGAQMLPGVFQKGQDVGKEPPEVFILSHQRFVFHPFCPYLLPVNVLK